jgi:DME family drug/metabolite transporter
MYGFWFILLAAMLWGTVGVSTRGLYTISETNPLSVGFFRLALAAPPLLVAGWCLPGAAMWRIAWRDLGLMLLFGALLAFYQVCYFAAIARVGVAIAALITLCMAPVIVALLAAVFAGERLTHTVALALVCAIVGTLLLVDLQPGAAQSTDILGVLLALGSATGYALITLLGQRLAGRYHPLQMTGVGFACGALLLLPVALATGLVVSYPPQGWLLLLYLGLVPSALAYGLFLIGMRSTPATTASIITLIEPLTATALAWLFFGERLGPLGLLGAAFLLGAIGLLYWGTARR